MRAGIPERVPMQLTGHKTRSVFECYNIVSECDLVEAAKKFYNSPEYQEARKHRQGACDFHMVVVEGTS